LKKERFEQLLNIERVAKAQLEVTRKQLMDAKISVQEKASVIEAEHAKKLSALVPELKMLERDNAHMTEELRKFEAKDKSNREALEQREQQVSDSKTRVLELELSLENVRSEMEQMKLQSNKMANEVISPMICRKDFADLRTEVSPLACT
jgi:hypothetical protein